tara:strand:- start:98 stop:544 length:447 start_codon:yes stop_codon:yes gene_type:complete
MAKKKRDLANPLSPSEGLGEYRAVASPKLEGLGEYGAVKGAKAGAQAGAKAAKAGAQAAQAAKAAARNRALKRGLPIASLPLAMSPGVSSKKKKSKNKKSAGKVVAKAAKSAIGAAVHKASGKSPKMKSKEGLAQERTKRQNTYYKKK